MVLWDPGSQNSSESNERQLDFDKGALHTAAVTLQTVMVTVSLHVKRS